MRRKAAVAVAAGALIVSVGSWIGSRGSAYAQGAATPGCTDATIRGTYGIQMQGTIPGPGGSQAAIGVAVRTYDGAGGFTQIDNLKGALTGIVPDRPGAGTYQVNEDCTAVMLLQPGPGVFIEERVVIVDHGNELRSITANPPPIMISAVARRIDRR
jgi:hypothetical protein